MRPPGRPGSVASHLRPLLESLLGPNPPVAFRFWDGSSLGGGASTIVVSSPLALRHLWWAPGELGFARAYVAGAIDVEGDFDAILNLRERLATRDGVPQLRIGPATLGVLTRAAAATGALGGRPPLPPEELRLRGLRHSKARDAAAIAHHYDISNDFFRLVLGETMTYSCALFSTEQTTLDEAQRAKYDLVCRKLGLRAGMRLLDVGCGWGGMVLHAATHYGVTAVGVTLSAHQAELAAKQVRERGLEGQVEIRNKDYRDLNDGPFDAISSIGMFEHVGEVRLGEYFERLASLLRDKGRLLNHGISRPTPSARSAAFKHASFVDRYVFPDGELLEVGRVVSAMQQRGFEVRDVESLREHYAQTLRCWVANLEANFDEAVRLVGQGRARVWRLYMAASALNFAANRTNIHQVLGVRSDKAGQSGMPRTRAEMLSGAGVTLGGDPESLLSD